MRVFEKVFSWIAEPKGAISGATAAFVRPVLLAPLRGVGMTAQATEEQHEPDHLEVSFLSTPYAHSAVF